MLRQKQAGFSGFSQGQKLFKVLSPVKPRSGKEQPFRHFIKNGKNVGIPLLKDVVFIYYSRYPGQ